MDDLVERAIAYVGRGTGLEDQIRVVEGLELPIANEEDKKRCRQVQQIVSMLQAYVDADVAKRPLSIVVFGPPGSGKSTFVDRITKALKHCRSIPTANLTQLTEPDGLVEAFKNGLAPPKQTEHAPGSVSLSSPAPVRELTPVFFFDEFDASLNDAPLGWLRWFLGPMQDGKLLADGRELEIGKAIFMFAGGTAESLDEFDRRAQLDPSVYRARKVPDFVSRLRGAIEIGGINGLGNARLVPRALALRRLLTKRRERLTDDQICQLLSNGHFVHGVRSMEALLDVQPAEVSGLGLPDTFRQQHFSRGVLDGQIVGISAGLNEPASQEMFSALTTQLLQNGASLAYGGDFVKHGTLHQVAKAAQLAPPDLDADADKPRPKRVYNYLGFPASLRAQSEADLGTESSAVEFIKLQTLNASELEELGAPSDRWFAALPIAQDEAYNLGHHVAWALSLFRMRLRVAQDFSALIVLGGKDDGLSWGRFAGIAEEVMIAIALRKPVYVLGGAGGAARATGQLLGLDATAPDLRRCLAPAVQAELAPALSAYAHCFEIPGEAKTPVHLAEIREFLYHRGVTTSAWPWNGLNLAENRRLFACPIADGKTHVDRAIQLIVSGLSRVDWKIRARQSA
jgi:SLOG cluster2